MVQEVFGVCSVSSGMEADEDTKEPGTMLKIILKPEKKESYAKGWKVEGDRGVPEGRSVGD